MSKQFWAVIAAIVLVLVGVAVYNGQKDDKNAAQTKGVVTNHVEGSTISGVKLVEFGDYQCPYCQLYYSTTKQVVATYQDRIQFQFVNFPLTSLHQNAFAAARAAEAAGKQNKYWEMHDLLYQNNDPNGSTGWVASSAPSSFFNQFATQVGLNLAQFKKDSESQAVNDAVNADMAKGNKLGVDATPTFYLDGKKVDSKNLVDSTGQPSATAFAKVLDAAIKQKATK